MKFFADVYGPERIIPTAVFPKRRPLGIFGEKSHHLFEGLP